MTSSFFLHQSSFFLQSHSKNIHLTVYDIDTILVFQSTMLLK